VVHHSSDQQQEQCHSAERAAHFWSRAVCSASGGVQIWLLQIAEVRIYHPFSLFEMRCIISKPKYIDFLSVDCIDMTFKGVVHFKKKKTFADNLLIPNVI